MEDTKFKALVLAGGLGLRLRSIVSSKPKVMAPVADKPFLEHVLNSLKTQCVTDIILSVGYKKESIISYFGDGLKFNINIRYSIENRPLGTGGAIKNAESFLKKTFIIVNGDTFIDLDYNEIIKFHNKRNSLITMALTKVEDSSRYGKVELDQHKRIINIHEKKSDNAKKCDLVNAGVYVIEPQIFSYIIAEKTVSFEKETMPEFVKKNLPIFGFETTGYFVDIGTPTSYQDAVKYFEKEGENAYKK